MATWVNPIDSETDPDAPLTSELGKRWDNNVVAAFEGAAGAVRLNKSIVSGTGTLVVSGMADWSGITVNGNYPIRSVAANLTIEFSSDGISYGAASTVLVMIPSSSDSFFIEVDKISGSFVGTRPGRRLTTGTVSGAGSSVTHIRISSTDGRAINSIVRRTGEII